MINLFQNKSTVVVDRTTRLEYSPQVDYDRPTPPRP
jgi:hypothetical protein